MTAARKKVVMTFEPKNERKERSTDINELAPQSSRKARRVRRPFVEILGSKQTDLERAHYALDRIYRLERQIEALLTSVGPSAAKLVLTERPSLRQYYPVENAQ